MKIKMITSFAICAIGSVFTINKLNTELEINEPIVVEDNIENEQSFEREHNTINEQQEDRIKDYTVNNILYVFSTVGMGTDDVVVRTEQDITAMYSELTNSELSDTEIEYLNEFITDYNNENPLVKILYVYSNSLLDTEEELKIATVEELSEEYLVTSGIEISELDLNLLLDYISNL